MFSSLMKSTFGKNPLLTVLIVISTILTALIGCFIFGVYQHYHITVSAGEAARKEINLNATHSVGIQSKRTDLYDLYSEDAKKAVEMYYSSINKGNLTQMLLDLPDNVKDNIDNIICHMQADDNVYGLSRYIFCFRPEKDLIVPVANDADQFTTKQYNSKKKMVRIGEDLYDPDKSSGQSSPYFHSDEKRTVSKSQTSLNINGDDYNIIGTLKNFPDAGGLIFINWGGLPDDTPLIYTVTITLKRLVDYSTYEQIDQSVERNMGGAARLEDLDLDAGIDESFYKTMILITAVVALLFSINLAVMYKYLVEYNKRKIAIIRICGCPRAKSVLIFLGQAMVIILPVFVLSLGAFHYLVYPQMTKLFQNSTNIFSMKVYLLVFAGYCLISFLVLSFMLIRSIGSKLDITEAAK